MHYIPLLFLCAKVFSFIYHRELALFLHNFRAIVEARRSTKKVHVVFIDKTTIFFMIFFSYSTVSGSLPVTAGNPDVCCYFFLLWSLMVSRDVLPVPMK